MTSLVASHLVAFTSEQDSATTCPLFFFPSRRRHTRCALVTGVQTCALPICPLRHPVAYLENLIAQSGLQTTPRRILLIMAAVEIGRASCRERVCQYV